MCNFFLADFNGFSVTTLLHFVVSIKRQLFVSCYSFGYEGFLFIIVSLGHSGRRSHAKKKPCIMIMVMTSIIVTKNY